MRSVRCQKGIDKGFYGQDLTNWREKGKHGAQIDSASMNIRSAFVDNGSRYTAASRERMFSFYVAPQRPFPD
jgi:hypothetical protein